MKSKNRKDSHITVMGKGEHETTSHNVACNNVTWPIRIYRCASIEQVCSNSVRVKDNDRLTGRVEVDEIA
jgi:hypothetical protein